MLTPKPRPDGKVCRQPCPFNPDEPPTFKMPPGHIPFSDATAKFLEEKAKREGMAQALIAEQQKRRGRP